MKVIGILTGVASFVAVAFKVHLFFKLRHHKRLAPGYTGLAGFFAVVFAFGTKGDHTVERDTVGEISDILEDIQEERNDQGEFLLSALWMCAS